MAALYGRKYVFSHIPKCGGKWTRKVLQEAGFTHTRDLSDGHHPAPAINNPAWISFTFIRHPATWLASWYAYCERTGWANRGRLPESFDRTRPYDRMVWESSSIDHKYGFENWVFDLERYYPGFVGRFFQPYIDSVQFVGKQETLARDLERIIGPLPDVPRFNVGDNVPKVRGKIYELVAEYEPLEKLGYSS